MKRRLAGVIAIVAIVAWSDLAEAQRGSSPGTFPVFTGRYQVTKEFNQEAALDTETGLIWERSVDGSVFSWVGAQGHCNTRIVGFRMGWRLPTVTELTSVLDATESDPALTKNVFGAHPFDLPQSDSLGRRFWVATQRADDPTVAYIVNINGGNVGLSDKFERNFVWCIRGGHGVDFQ